MNKSCEFENLSLIIGDLNHISTFGFVSVPKAILFCIDEAVPEKHVVYLAGGRNQEASDRKVELFLIPP